MKKGYISLWRKSIDSMAFANPELWKLWCLCLMKANHKKGWVAIEEQSEPIKIEAGQFITGRYTLHKDYYKRKKKNNKSPYTVWRWLQILEKYENLSIKSYNKYSIITIRNWNMYNNNVQQVSNRCATGEQQVSTNNNDNNDNNTNQCPFQDIVNLFNKVLVGLPSVRILTPERKNNLKARWNTSEKTQSLEWWETYFKSILASDFLMGKTNKPFSCGFDWIIKKGNFIKIIEGNYNGKT